MRKWRRAMLALLMLPAFSEGGPGPQELPAESAGTGSTAGSFFTSSKAATPAVGSAQAELDRLRLLAPTGAVSQRQLEEAAARLADAEDDAALRSLLFATDPSQPLSPAQCEEIVAAAERQLERQRALLAAREGLVAQGIVAQSELGQLKTELASRESALALAHERVALTRQLTAIARAEQANQRQAQIRFVGAIQSAMNGPQPTLLTQLGRAYESRWGDPLPVSALGQTAIHDWLGFDHRGKVDIALAPDSERGRWLRRLLEQHRVSYVAFPSAVAGAATGPHIHIGSPSARLSARSSVQHVGALDGNGFGGSGQPERRAADRAGRSMRRAHATAHRQRNGTGS